MNFQVGVGVAEALPQPQVYPFLECLLSMNDKLDSIPTPYKLNMVVHTCNPRTVEVEAGKSEVKGQPQLLGGLRPTLVT